MILNEDVELFYFWNFPINAPQKQLIIEIKKQESLARKNKQLLHEKNIFC